ncbi:DUF4241 domain-containing protein [Streptomyces spiramenti]|uniref:DUF4241 domain-containing protein n=1 Tax=Streptomyces spiramenti TaxID=2720606 RepID=A0ABX1API9_9ACTN|nr:DUF4241 domain-containing protein [Streptomyces spiramenti]NJP66237.1 DUF4241 domain-containing protein [Streptomyces spiramenti]
MAVSPPDFAQILAPGAVHPVFEDGTTLRVRELPGVPLSLPTGRLIAMEPFGAGMGDADELAFLDTVAPGTYPVVLSLVDVHEPDGSFTGDSRVAAARLVVSEEPVARWELALSSGQDLADLEDDEFYGYPVDGGTGSFMDVETFHSIGDQDFGDRVLSAMFPVTEEESTVEPPEPADDPVTLPVGEDEHAVVAFSTGWGDGAYATWTGRTADGSIACFLTDFSTMDEEYEDEAEHRDDEHHDGEHEDDQVVADVTQERATASASA